MEWFANALLEWAKIFGRKGLPWQADRTAYRVWVSEIMLQQTQVSTVLSHYDPFLKRFPTIEVLASASEDEVLHVWIGLGYYRRALRLREAALKIVHECNGEFPTTVEELCALPGIGKSTAGAILSFAYDIPAPILDANVRRLLCRFHAVNGPSNTKISESDLWKVAEQHIPHDQAAAYTQAIMDFGALQCRRSHPKCESCPLQDRCLAYQQDAVELYSQSRSQSKLVSMVKRQLVIFDREGLCLMQQRDSSGLFAKLWEPPDLPIDAQPREILDQLNLPLNGLQIIKGLSPPPYTISNQRVQEDITIAKYELSASSLGTPAGTRWYSVDANDIAGVSVKTLKRIDLAKSSLEHS